MKQIVIEYVAPDNFRLSIDAVPAEFTQDGLRSELQKRFRGHAMDPVETADKLIRDTGQGRIELNFRDRPVTPLTA